jgi:hypothetical protein
MEYLLPDGQKVELSRIKEITQIRDLGLDPGSIDRSVLSFSIRLRGGKTIQIKEYYHFSDWSEAKKSLKKIHASLMEQWQQSSPSQKTD